MFFWNRPSLRELILNQGRKLMSISQEVQANLDAVRSLTSVVQSVDAGIGALRQQIATLQAQITGTPSLSDEDKAALLESTNDVNSMLDTLKNDIPASTPAAGGDTGQAQQGSAG